jgi:protein-S-isoprenylcysteine O-methyltransferase Ste14
VLQTSEWLKQFHDMGSTLLATKLYVPPTCPTLVVRPRLAADLAKALTRHLTLVAAPAGYGKTTLVSSWLRETDIASAWLSLDDGDNDPIRFLQYFLSALHQIIPTVQLDLLDLLRGTRPAQADALLNCLISEIAEHAASFVPVLDDFHVIHAQPILEMPAFLLDHLPPQMHLVCLSRTDPDLPLARLTVTEPWILMVVEIVGLLLYVTGYLLMAGALITLGRSYQLGGSTPRSEDQMVVRGPYRLIRHPMYTAALSIALGLACLIQSGAFFGVFGIYLALIIPLISMEEEGLRKAYGAQYGVYQQKTRKLIPFTY